MSLRILVRPQPIADWITERSGTPARKRGSDTELTVLFGDERGDYDRISMDELMQTMKFHHLVVLVEQQPGSMFHRFIQHA